MKIKWSAIKNVIDLIQGIAAIAVVIGLYFTVQTLQESRQVESAKFILEINRDLRSKQFNEISHAINGEYDSQIHSSSTPILKESGGQFTHGQLDDYLAVYNNIGALYQDGLLDDMAEEEFFYSAGKIWCNKDIKQYITDIRKVDGSLEGEEAYYYGIEYLAKKSLDDNKRHCSDLDKQ